MNGILLELYRKFGKRRVFLAVWILLTTLAGLFALGLFGRNQEAVLHGTLWRFSERREGYAVMRDPGGDALILEYAGGRGAFDYRASVRFQEAEILCESTLDGQWYRFSDGSEVSLSQEQIFTGRDGEVTLWQSKEREFLHRLLRYYHEGANAEDYVLITVIAASLLLFSCGLYFYPVVFWKLRTRMQLNDGEPSRWALSGNRIAGILIAVGAYAFLAYVCLVVFRM